MLSNLPFYLALLPLFLEASVARVEARAGPRAGSAAGQRHGCARGLLPAGQQAWLSRAGGLPHAAPPATPPAPQVRGESAAQDLVAVLGVLEGAPGLRELLQRVEREFNKYAGEPDWPSLP